MSRNCFWKALLFTLLASFAMAEEVVVTLYSSPDAVVTNAAGEELGHILLFTVAVAWDHREKRGPHLTPIQDSGAS